MNLNGTPTNPGELRTKVTLQKRVTTADAGGFKVCSYTDLATVWAKWENAHGTEAMAAGSVGAGQQATVTIRYRADIDETCVVVKSGVRYEIVNIDDIRERHEYMELIVKRTAAG